MLTASNQKDRPYWIKLFQPIRNSRLKEKTTTIKNEILDRKKSLNLFFLILSYDTEKIKVKNT